MSQTMNLATANVRTSLGPATIRRPDPPRLVTENGDFIVTENGDFIAATPEGS